MSRTGNMISSKVLNPFAYISLKTNVSISFMEPTYSAFSELHGTILP